MVSVLVPVLYRSCTNPLRLSGSGGGQATAESEDQGQDSIDNLDPKDDEGFQQLGKALVKKITHYEVIKHILLSSLHMEDSFNVEKIAVCRVSGKFVSRLLCRMYVIDHSISQ